MSEDRRTAVAALHRARILAAAETLFAQKGFDQTTIDDLSRASGYSRRTIYAYYQGKGDILLSCAAAGLRALKADIEAALGSGGDFAARYFAVCGAMRSYHRNYPFSVGRISTAEASSAAAGEIYALGEEINARLAGFIQEGQAAGAVRQDVRPEPAVYALWAGIHGLIELAAARGTHIERQLGMDADAFLEYGFGQLINGILEERL